MGSKSGEKIVETELHYSGYLLNLTSQRCFDIARGFDVTWTTRSSNKVCAAHEGMTQSPGFSELMAIPESGVATGGSCSRVSTYLSIIS